MDKELKARHCVPCEGGVPPLPPEQVRELLDRLEGWSADERSARIDRDFRFRDFYETVAFVNAVAWIANREDHHPDLEVGYNHCTVHYSTHAVGGLSANDFICAAKIDALIVP